MQYVIRNTSLPIDLLKNKEKDPWSKEDKLLLLGANVSTANDQKMDKAPKKSTQNAPKTVSEQCRNSERTVAFNTVLSGNFDSETVRRNLRTQSG